MTITIPDFWLGVILGAISATVLIVGIALTCVSSAEDEV